MHSQLNYIHAQEHIAELHRAARRARLATNPATERNSRDFLTPLTRLGARLARLTRGSRPHGHEISET